MSTAVKEIQKNISLVFAYFQLNLSSAMEYRVSFLIQLFGMVLNNVSFAFFWWLLFEKVPTIAGYGYQDVMILWAISSAGFGLAFIFFGGVLKLNQYIIKGELDSFLLQPKNVLLNVISSSTVFSAWGDLLYGTVLFIVIKGVHPLGLLSFAFYCFTAMILFVTVIGTAHSLAFYMGNNSSMVQLIFEFMISFSIYPEGIFKGAVKWIIFTILPAGFITMVPLRLLQNFDIRWFLLLIGVCIIWITILFTVFHKGLKKYESGNLMVNRM